MARALTSGMVAEVTAASLTPIFLAKFSFDAGDLNLWNGIGDLIWNGDAYTGSADLGRISAVSESQTLQAQGVTFELSGIPSAIIATALAQEYQGRPAQLWFATLDANNAIVADPYLVFRGKMDVMTIAESGETAIIAMAAENELVALDRPNERRYTPEDQATVFAGDKGFDFVVSLQDAEIIWGRAG